MFEFVKQAFNQVTLLEQPPVRIALNEAIFATGDDGVRLLFFQQGDDFVGVIASVSQDVFAFDVHGLKHLIADHAIIDVSCGHFICEWVAQGIHNRVNLAG